MGSVEIMIENRTEFLREWISPFVAAKMKDGPEILPGIVPSYGMSETGYDIRLGDEVPLCPGKGYLGISLERVQMPLTHCAKVGGKSTLARLGIHLNVTEIDPGFFGRITLEISYLPVWGERVIEFLPAGCGIGVIQFHELRRPCRYGGKYQGDETAQRAR